MKASPPGDKRYHLGLRLRAEQGLGSPLTAPLWVCARRNASRGLAVPASRLLILVAWDQAGHQRAQCPGKHVSLGASI